MIKWSIGQVAFPLANGANRALNPDMDKDPRTVPAHKSWVTLIRDLISRRKWTYTLFCGAAAGMAVGVLNLVAVAQQWQKLDDTFELLNLPITSMIPGAQYRFGPLMGIGYWPFIGMFLASLICFAGDRKCRRLLLFGLAGGVLVGGLNLLVKANRWSGLERDFDFFDQPVKSLEEAIRERMESNLDWIIRTTRGIPTVPYWRLTYVAYWTIVGLFLALLVCAIQTLRKKRRAAETRV